MIYTPQTVTITCAAGQEDDSQALSVTIPPDASRDQVMEANRRALRLAWQSQGPVVLRRLQ